MNIIENDSEGNGILQLKIEGEVTIYNAEQIKTTVFDKLMTYVGIELDLSCVTEIDSSGYQLLVLMKRECSISGKSFKIRGESGVVKNIFGIYGGFASVD